MKRALAIGTLCLYALPAQELTHAAAPSPIQLPSESVTLKPSAHPGFLLAQQKCLICHSVDYIAYQPPAMKLAQWTAEVTKMQRVYGAPISEQEIGVIAAYLALSYGDASTVVDAEAPR